MVTTDSEIISQGEMDSPLQSSQQQAKNQTSSTLQSLGRQSSIYSLTLDEFQHTLSESGKNFGSMNMDEFLNSIWTAEENQAQAQGQQGMSMLPTTNGGSSSTTLHLTLQETKGIAKQPSLPRQGSLSIPEPLCRKTVDEVWSEIHKEQQHAHTHIQNPNTTQKQATFGEMTLEDFLVRAGVVREQNYAAPAPPQQPSFGMFQNNNHPAMGPIVARPVMAVGVAAAGVSNVAGYQPLQSGVGEAQGYSGGMKRGNGYPQPPPPVGYGGRLGNGSGGGFGQVQGLGMGSPVSPLSDGMGTNQVDSGNQYGMEGMRGGRKRNMDGPVEKVVERRQRRMIKNRESAARSRARKQVH